MNSISSFLDFVLRTLTLVDGSDEREVFNAGLPRVPAKQLVAVHVESPAHVDPATIEPQNEKSYIRDAWARKGNTTPDYGLSGALSPDKLHAPKTRLRFDSLATAQAGPGHWLLILETSAKPVKIKASTLASPAWAASPDTAADWKLDADVCVIEKAQIWDLLTFLWVGYGQGSSGQAPPRVSSAIAISASGVWNP
ncbi:hypothetical protein ABLE94_24460 [Gordonia sp. VNK1]|uniref:hypothetical protein n=1 Tax=Gordonia oleivorans TaxID=3156618 RepID=UPI0032B60316